MNKEEKESLDGCKDRLSSGKKIFGYHYLNFCKEVQRIVKRTGTDESYLCPYCFKKKGILSSESIQQLEDKYGPPPGTTSIGAKVK